MFALFLTFFIVFVAANLFFSAAVVYHLRQYTLPGWNAARIILPIYGVLSLFFLGIALYSFLHVPFT